eukprot:657551_1
MAAFKRKETQKMQETNCIQLNNEAICGNYIAPCREPQMFNKYNSDNALPHTDANTHNVNDTRVSCPLEHVVCYMLFAHHLSVPFCVFVDLFPSQYLHFILRNTSTLLFVVTSFPWCDRFILSTRFGYFS